MSEQKEIWDLEQILDGKTIEQFYTEIKEKAEIFKKYREQLTEDITPELVLEIIQLKEEMSVLSGKLNAYVSMKFYVDTKDSKILAEMTKINQFSTDVGNELMFFSLWFINVNEETANKLIESEKLVNYKFYLENLRKQKQYTKSEEIERIMNIKDMTGGDSTSDLYEIFVNTFEFEHNGKKITKEEMTGMFQSSKPEERENAYKTVYSKYRDNSTLLSEMYKNIVLDWDNDTVKIRGYKEPVSVRNIGNNAEDKAVRALVKTVQKNWHIFAEYFKLKYEINKKSGAKYEYSRYHIYAPYAKQTERKYSYEETKKIVLDMYKEFHPKFYEHAMEIFDKKHVHSHPQENKRAGAFCYGVTPEDVPYVMLNHTDRLRDVFTMIHEFGHGIHDQFARKQTSINFHPGLVMAETASIFSEIMLFEKLIGTAQTDEEKISLLISFFGDSYATIARQIGFFMFEEIAHEKISKGATKEELDEEYYEILKQQFGDMKIPEEFKSEWNYIPHIHASPFYVYAYAWGQLLVLALYALYKEEGESFKEKYIKLLETGGSKAPAEILGELGIDPSKEEFWQKGFDILREKLEQLKELV